MKKNLFSKLKFFLMSMVVLSLAGCSNMKIDDYQGSLPAFDLFAYFEGKTKAYGQFQDRSSNVIRRFEVDIIGKLNHKKNILVLNEAFTYDDGEKQTRIWTITKNEDGHYTGTASDVIGEARGITSGYALNWTYTLDLPYKDSTIHVQFNDWMFLHNKDVMLNRAEVSKWGIKVGEVTLFFSKALAAMNQ